jgi:hypothetical protein
LLSPFSNIQKLMLQSVAPILLRLPPYAGASGFLNFSQSGERPDR